MDAFDFLLAAGVTPGMCPEYLVSPAMLPARKCLCKRPTASAEAIGAAT